MKTLTLILALVIAATACGARQKNPSLDALQKQLAEQKEEIARLKQAAADGYKPPGLGGLPTDTPKPPDVAGQTAMSGGVAGGVPSGTILVRGEPASYPGAFGTEPRQQTLGKKLKLENMICDGGYDAGSNCRDTDGIGGADYNYAVSYMIEGKPAGCGNGFQLHNDGPCFVEIGGARKVTLTVRRHRLQGTPRAPVINTSSDDGSYTMVVSMRENITLHQVNEHKFR